MNDVVNFDELQKYDGQRVKDVYTIDEESSCDFQLGDQQLLASPNPNDTFVNPGFKFDLDYSSPVKGR